MKMIIVVNTLSAVLLYLIPAVTAQTITQDEFLTQLRAVHPLFAKEELTADIEEQNRNSLTGDQDWNLNSSIIFSHEEPAIAIFGPEKTDALSLTGGVDKLFWKTGGILSASYTFNRVDMKIDPFLGIPDLYYQNQLSVSYLHPIFQNRKGFLSQLSYNLSGFEIDYAKIQSLENQEDFLAAAASKFIEWAYLSEQNSIISERYKLSEDALANTKSKREANLIDEVDLLRAEDAVAIAKQSLVLSESQFSGLGAELAVLTKNNSMNDLQPEYDLYELRSLPSIDTIEANIRQKSRLIQAIDRRIAQLEYARLGYEEMTKPRLSLLAQFNIKEADEKFGSALGMDKPDFIGGLQFSVPLERRTSRYSISKTDLQINQLELQKEEILLTLTAAVNNIYIRIKEMENILKLNLKQIETAESKTAEELILYNRGRSDLTFVIQSQDGEQNAKLNYALNAAAYQQLYLRYLALTDALLN